MARNIFENAIAFSRPDAAQVGQWEDTAYFLRVPPGLGPFVQAVVFWARREAWTGGPEEVENAVEVVKEFLAQEGQTLEEIMEACPWYGANFRLTEEGNLEAQQGLDLVPPPWEFRLVQAEGGAHLEFRTQEPEP